MAFFGSQFSFDGVPCFEYGLMVYDIDSISEGGKFASTATKIYEDRTAWRSTPLHYGVTRNTALTFSFTFGANMESIDKNMYLDRWEMNTIATWLTGHDEYKYLEIMQPDMEAVRYKCIITSLEYTTYGNMPWAFKCTVTCDSPFGYLYPENHRYTVNDSLEINFNNKASCKYYYPKLKITILNGNSFSIVNHSDNDREFLFANIPAAPIEIVIDNENEIITNNHSLNLYDNFNYKFLRLLQSYNKLELKANSAIVELDCEFPINIGG
jgi:hypothetical protein